MATKQEKAKISKSLSSTDSDLKLKVLDSTE
jgi:hypothetical protein